LIDDVMVCIILYSMDHGMSNIADTHHDTGGYTMRSVTVGILFLLLSACVTTAAADPTEREVLDAMKAATRFMVEEFSYRGGYAGQANTDLTEWHNEVPGRRTQIFVQGGTTPMGENLLSLYKLTGDEYYLHAAERAANALIYGQHPKGGWHYIIDFNMTDIREFYRDVASRHQGGYEEYRHFYGNCTFDDNTTQGPTQLLLNLYMETLDPKYRQPLLKALDFILEAQYPNGGWPQRYPLSFEYAHHGYKDYTSNYTLNDGSLRNCMWVLIDAYERLGDERYFEAARRAADFLVLVQLPEPQAAWCDQYDMDLKPAWARTHEPPAILSRQTVNTVKTMLDFYLYTGDKRYLEPVAPALRWMRDSTIKIMDDGTHGLGRFYDIGTNMKLNYASTQRFYEEGYRIIELHDPIPWEEKHIWIQIDIATIEQRLNRYSAMTPEEAKAEYYRLKQGTGGRGSVNPAVVEELIESLDDSGRWIEELVFHDVAMPMRADNRRKTVQGMSVDTYIDNMNVFRAYLQEIAD
jgi:PelA/Pel-15E family pectate lyase